ncbi:hypothetical protein [Pseudoalteromonas luteoviolacea]|uniref:Uncharacterized protein n=1 Tax=Pseudoalteromonas luteoviolacea S4054 TaxID=1129367 RepID=A0A0F6AG57_9GAMM|nr:hypothetical protein [Pseudoalteromonas luteoviolacea]AOT08395.1 hypothetical protein S4054249_11300 [Pseudoalteromonas luteoviolacea]AOT13311.1 hypothetical protein S40542_11275 [Pseudoalteromonas luteoviolacea]AOT18224.1 hypothetical protein S4054_11275 [Pseudoalteromonas luteoviolacea]KKE84344.1 hypothetical protein N479_10625 [Pseudoalteromonas luteoviolacea S4054]KZN76051.1 hypothetical protein N481_06790 [Pseudoalteromonas luteoviolacea S4047-1]
MPSIARWGASSTFGLDNLNSIDGSFWHDWRASMRQLNCHWAIPIIEDAQKTKNIKAAIAEIVQRSNDGRV